MPSPGDDPTNPTSLELASELDEVLPATRSREPRVIGLGGSAGSIQALQQFLTAMPPDSGMVFVVVLHLSPDHDSMLGDVLQRSTEMKVVVVTDQLRIAPNCVYVIPPGKQLSLKDERLLLTELTREPRRATVDLFFRSLADSRGARSASCCPGPTVTARWASSA